MLKHSNDPLGSKKRGEFVEYKRHRELLKYESAQWSHLVNAKMPLHSSVSIQSQHLLWTLKLTLTVAIYFVVKINNIMSFHYIFNGFQH